MHSTFHTVTVVVLIAWGPWVGLIWCVMPDYGWSVDHSMTDFIYKYTGLLKCSVVSWRKLISRRNWDHLVSLLVEVQSKVVFYHWFVHFSFCAVTGASSISISRAIVRTNSNVMVIKLQVTFGEWCDSAFLSLSSLFSLSFPLLFLPPSLPPSLHSPLALPS